MLGGNNMSKYDYLHALYQELLSLDAKERSRIMREVENKFRQAEDLGNNELSVTQSLGTPKEYAKQFQNESVDSSVHFEPNPNATKVQSIPVKEPLLPTKYKDEPQNKARTRVYTSPQANPVKRGSANPVRILLMSFLMLLVNAIVIGPFIALWAVAITFVAVCFTFVISGIIIIISGVAPASFFFLSLPDILIQHPVLLYSSGLFFIGTGGFIAVLMVYIIRFYGMLTTKYASWNIRIIRGY